MSIASTALERFEFRDFNGRTACCRLEILPLTDGRTAIIATEVADNTGMSITNAAELAAAAACWQFDVDPNRLVWIEHYDDGSYRGGGREESFDRVTFGKVTPMADSMFTAPSWKRMKAEDWVELGLQPSTSIG